MPEQIRDEIKGVANLINSVYSLFGFKYHVELYCVGCIDRRNQQ